VLSIEQQQRLQELVPLTAGKTVTSASGSFRAACLLEFGLPAPDQLDVERALRERLARRPRL
jgi:hypothetical protein